MLSNCPGEKYGNLRVMEIAGCSGHDDKVLCRCYCGTLVICSYNDLLMNKRTDCGRHVKRYKKRKLRSEGIIV